MNRKFFRPLAASVAALGLAIASHAGHAEEVRQQFNGLTLNANLETVSPKGIADGVVLITHGTLAHNRMEIIEALQNLLADRGVNSLAINLGLAIDDRHGAYDCAVPHRHRYADAAEEIAAWVQWLRDKGAGPIAVMGHSRGGAQTAHFAATKGADLSRVILLAPAYVDDERTAKGYAAAYGRPLDTILRQAADLVAAGGKAPLKGVGFLYCPDATVDPATFVSYYRPDASADTPALLPRIAAPVLVIAGGSDDVVPDIANRVKPLANRKQIKLKMIDGADHFFRDLYAEDVADAVGDVHAQIEGLVPHLRRYARALTRDATAADDLVQDCLARAFSRVHLWRRGSNLRAWLFTIMHNIYVNQVRKNSLAGAAVDYDRTAHLVSDPPRQEHGLMVADLNRALGQLPDEQRAVVLLVGLEGLSYEEVAKIVGVPIGTVMSRLSRGREKLRRLLEGDGPTVLRRVK